MGDITVNPQAGGIPVQSIQELQASADIKKTGKTRQKTVDQLTRSEQLPQGLAETLLASLQPHSPALAAVKSGLVTSLSTAIKTVSSAQSGVPSAGNQWLSASYIVALNASVTYIVRVQGMLRMFETQKIAQDIDLMTETGKLKFLEQMKAAQHAYESEIAQSNAAIGQATIAGVQLGVASYSAVAAKGTVAHEAEQKLREVDSLKAKVPDLEKEKKETLKIIGDKERELRDVQKQAASPARRRELEEKLEMTEPDALNRQIRINEASIKKINERPGPLAEVDAKEDSLRLHKLEKENKELRTQLQEMNDPKKRLDMQAKIKEEIQVNEDNLPHSNFAHRSPAEQDKLSRKEYHIKSEITEQQTKVIKHDQQIAQAKRDLKAAEAEYEVLKGAFPFAKIGEHMQRNPVYLWSQAAAQLGNAIIDSWKHKAMGEAQLQAEKERAIADLLSMYSQAIMKDWEAASADLNSSQQVMNEVLQFAKDSKEKGTYRISS